MKSKRLPPIGCAAAPSANQERAKRRRRLRAQQAMSRLLEVRVLEARNVIACDRGGTSDPYVVLTLVDIAGREIKGEKQKTEKINKTLNPRWNATLVLGTCSDRAHTRAAVGDSLSLLHSWTGAHPAACVRRRVVFVRLA